MADQDELNRRREAREAQRRQRRRAKRLMQLRVGIAAVVLIACGVGIFLLTRDSVQPEQTLPTEEKEMALELPQATEAPTEDRASWERAPEVIHIAAAGDLNITDKVIWSGQNGNVFDYTRAFMDVSPVFSGADLALLNFEGNVCGAPYDGGSMSAPVELVQALKNAGVDVVQMANSCTINNGLIGLQSTLNNIPSAGIEPVGAFSTNEEFRKSKGYTICNVGDVKIALVAFTKGVGSLGLPTGSEECVNLLYTDYFTTYQDVDTDGIRKILRSAEAENPDLTIALLHWGSEYNEKISDSQERIVTLMQKEGVDAIIGTHPHLVHKIDFNQETGKLVAYSLGDFFGDGSRGGSNYSIILDLEITKDYDSGETRITDYSYTPIYTLSEDECDGQRRVVRIQNAMSAYELNYVDKITKSAYDSMTKALERIGERINPKPEEEKK